MLATTNLTARQMTTRCVDDLGPPVLLGPTRVRLFPLDRRRPVLPIGMRNQGPSQRVAGKPVTSSLRRIARVQTVVLVGRDDLQVREMSRKLHLSDSDRFLRCIMGGLAFRRLASRISKQRRAKFDALTAKQREAEFAYRYAMRQAVAKAINESVCKDGVVFHFDSPGGPTGFDAL